MDDTHISQMDGEHLSKLGTGRRGHSNHNTNNGNPLKHVILSTTTTIIEGFWNIPWPGVWAA